jgi:bifunctional DNase/RNase
VKALSVRGVRLDRLTNTPVVTLREDEAPRRQFEIFIGAPEAASIKIALDDEITPRPLTHDLFVLALESLNVSVTRVVLTHVSSGTYYADLVLMPDGEEVVVSSRPSDAIAIALRASCPIYASDELIDMVGEVIEEEEEAQEQSGIIDEFKNFIENINPEDFA